MPPPAPPTLTKSLRLLLPRLPLRTLTTTPPRRAEGDTGAPRAHPDAFTKREKAAEDLWIREREKHVIAVLREKIARQEAMLTEDRKALARMEDQYGKVVEG